MASDNSPKNREITLNIYLFLNSGYNANFEKTNNEIGSIVEEFLVASRSRRLNILFSSFFLSFFFFHTIYKIYVILGFLMRNLCWP